MKLQRVRVKQYKSALDSDWFSVGDLTCLVGKNESGKTAILEALEKLNSVQETREDFEDTEHYPRLRLSEYQESKEVAVPIESTWDLEDEEIKHINSMVDVDILLSTQVGLTKSYENKLDWSFQLDQLAAVEHLLAESGLNQTERSKLGDPKSVADLIKALKAVAEPSARQSSFLEELNGKISSGALHATVVKYLRSRLPNFLYYSSYDRLPGQVSLNQLLRDIENDALERDPGNKVFIALLSMVGTTPDAIKDITASEELIAKLEAVENRLTQRIFKYWTQNNHLEVNFRFDEALPGDEPPFNEGKVFRTRIKNKRHGVTIKLDERSAGFIWFFSFLVWFSEVQRQHGDNLIVLLDEPGLTLHARAQGDLLRFLKAELLPKYQVIYTTHSPFMVDASDLLACRTVEDVTGPGDELLGTRVGDDVLSTDRDTLFPLQAALGYDITQTLFIGKHSLLVEGPSDLLYLQWFSNELARQKRTHLDPRWTITPCGGITKVSIFMALFGGGNLHVAVLTDHGQGDKRKVRELRESELLRDGHVLTADAFVEGDEADIEDIIGREMYVPLVNGAFQLKGRQAIASASNTDRTRITEEVEEHFRTQATSGPEFDHLTPARFLVESPVSSSLPGLVDALNRFERLFSEINQLLADSKAIIQGELVRG